MQLRGKRISVLGAGRSGLAVARLLKKRRAQVFLSEQAPAKKFPELMTELDQLEVQHEFGKNTHRVLEADLIVISPGVPLETPIVKLARDKGIKIISEIELGYQFCNAPIVAVTGTNGKTTTTTLIGEIFRQHGWTTFVGGNIGIPFCDIADEAKGENTIVVLEVSSFQLDTIDEFRPKVSMILNITPDHLDRYPNYESYIQSKFRIAENQKGQDLFIYNYDDEVLRSFADTLSIKTSGFSIKETLRYGAWLEHDQLVMRLGREKETVIDRGAIGIPGPHNLMNVMAASLATRAMQVEPQSIASTLRAFKGVEHRIEFVRELDGVEYYNDSKATNVDSVFYALGSFDRPIVLVAGGKDKGNDYTALLPLVKEHVKAIVAIGDGAAKLEAAFNAVVPVHQVGHSMEHAVECARSLARAGEIVLLSPACASFDMFNNYEHRGQVFKELVHALK